MKTNSHKAILHQRIKDELDNKLKAALERKRAIKLVYPKPRYDEVYFRGLEWLETL